MLAFSTYVLRINITNICPPTVANDMFLMTLSKLGRDVLMRTCILYSCKKRYEYVSPKCSVIVFNELRSKLQKSERQWYLGPCSMKEEETYKCLGKVVSKYMTI